MAEPTRSSLCGKRPRRLLHDNIWPLSFFCLLPSILLSSWSTYTTSATTTLAFQLNDCTMISNTCDYRRRPCRRVMRTSSPSSSSPLLLLRAAPEGALSDIVVHSVFDFLDGVGVGVDSVDGSDGEEDPRIWVPQTDRLSFRPLCFCTSQGYYVNLLKFKGGGVLGRHRHSSPVHALTLRGSWRYVEHDWHAKPGTYVFEPPGETHTLVVDDGCDEMVALFYVTGSLLYVSGGGAEDGDGEEEEEEVVTGYDDVFTKLEKARRWYESCGLGRDYADRLVR